jgi:hypothetical protein
VRRWKIASTVVACALATAQSASAAPQWLTPPQPFDAAQVQDSSATMAPDGTVAVARVAQRLSIEVRIRPPGGSFGPAVSLTPAYDEAPRLVAGPNGYIAAVWRSGFNEYAAVRTPGGTFGEAHPIGFESPVGPQQAAVDGSGRVWVLSNLYNPARVVTVDAYGNTIASELGVGRGWEVQGAALGVDATGLATVVYTQSRSAWGPNDGDPCSSQSQVRVAEGYAHVTDVGVLAEAAETGIYHLGQCTHVTGTETGAASVTVHPSGEAVATYQLGTVNDADPQQWTEQWQTLARVRPAAGAWPGAGTPAEPVGTSQDWAWLASAFAGDTPIVMLWNPNAHPVELSARGPGGWSAPQALAPEGGGSPLLAASPSGTAAVVYAANAQVMGVVRAPDGTLSAPAPLSGSLTDTPRVNGIAMDDAGNAVAVWNEGPWYTPHVVVAGYDGAGPQLSASFPSYGDPGASLPFTMSALDVWSGVASEDWSFGDGKSASGGTVSHAFGSVGTFPVTVTAVDGLGNASARSASLQIGGPPDVTRPTFTVEPSIRPRRVRRGHLATVSFGVSEAATVRVTVLASRSGVRSGRRCVAPRRSRRRSVRRCRRGVTVLRRAKHSSGNGIVHFPIDTTRLRAGRYQIAVNATDLAGNRSKTIALSLTVMPRAH